MPAFLLALPALVAQAPSTSQALDPLQDLLRSIPIALAEGKPASVKGQVVKAKAAWEQIKPSLGKSLPEPETTFIDRQLAAMQKMKPREQAMGAIGISTTLSRYQGKTRKQELLQAQRTALAAWCGVDSGHWDPFPGVGEAFRPIMEKDNGAHAMVVIGIQGTLKRLQESRQKHQAAATKKALKELVSFVDVLGKS
jgi:hypothetical protein